MSKSPKDTKGPVVKTGPTKGKNRSRTNEGTWRAKRSDAGKSRPSKSSSESGKKGCFLTTAACELRGLADDCDELTTLRHFRDEVLLFSREGRTLVEEYYNEAPSLVPFIKDGEENKRVWHDIQETVAHIERGHHTEAIASYFSMFERLRTKRIEN
tara:strand:- start:12211 stop:12678 length:468 start_codon:yes stop_codon:yes gene_type:complete